MLNIFLLIGIYFLLTVGCIIKILRHFKSVEFNLLWLILYNEAIIILSAYAISTPSAELEPGTIRGYFPGELIMITFVPLILIGLTMKLNFLFAEDKEQVKLTECEGMQYFIQWCKGSRANFLYIIFSLIPGGLLSCMLFVKLFKLPASLLLCGISTIIMSLLPRIYEYLKS